MSSNDQNQLSMTCPPPSTGPYEAPPPAVCPTMDNSANQDQALVETGRYVAPAPAVNPTMDTSANQNQAPVETNSRGDAFCFWNGDFAGLCCCSCVLGACS